MMQHKQKFIICLIFLFLSVFQSANAVIKMSGSSTVYPFAIVMAEEFSFKTKLEAPIVESVGTGGGFAVFCKGNDANSPDIVNASRRIKESEKEQCSTNNVSFTKEAIGLDAIIVAMHSNTNSKYFIPSLTSKELFDAFARNVVVDGNVVPNPYMKWSQINPKLPDIEISIYGPPSTSGTRDSFTEIVLTDYCTKQPEFQKHYTTKLKQRCSLIRNDGRFVESGENDTFIVHKISLKNGSVGIFGYSHYMENHSKMHAIKVDGIPPSNQTIATGKYKIARPLFLYFKESSLQKNPEVKLFYKEVTSSSAIGVGGYLEGYHLIPVVSQ